MKKTILSLALAMGVSTFSMAQEQTFKPVEGMTSLEITFNPSAIFNASNNGDMFALPSIGGLNQGIKYRQWANETTAYRGTFLLGFVSSNEPFTALNSQGGLVDMKNTYSEWAVQIRPGMEKHLGGTKRLSPYIGSELIFGYGSNKATMQRLDTADVVVEDVVKNDPNAHNPNHSGWNYATGFTAGIGAIAGFDYYIAKDLYLGLELNYAFVFNASNKIVRDDHGSEAVETKQGTNWYFNPSTGANFKLGWNF